jgi:hypothetical protein
MWSYAASTCGGLATSCGSLLGGSTLSIRREFNRILLAWFTNDAELEVSPDLVTLRRGRKSLSLRPVVYIHRDASPCRVLAVGTSEGLVEPYIEVRLFASTAPLPLEELTKGNCLEALLRYAILKVARGGTLVNPRLFVSGLESVGSVFGGYQGWLLREAAIKAGARELVFRPKPC